MAEVLHEVIDGGVGLVTLNAPERRNAISLSLVTEVADTMDRLEQDSAVGAIVVTGAPPAFCAGAVLEDLTSADRDRLTRIYDGFLRIARSPLPTVAAVNGAAVGAGLNLALSCDIRLAAESSRWIARFAELGIFPGGGHTWMLTRIAGIQTAMAMDLFGDELDGRGAERVGLAWRCLPDDQLLDESTRLARWAAAAPGELMRRMKDVIRGMPAVKRHDEAVAIEAEHQLWSLGTPEAVERLGAMQRRISGR